MPLTPFQKAILRLLAINRNPESHLAGGTVLNRDDASPRYSSDLDLFHDAADSVARSAALDGKTLEYHGYRVEWLLQQPGFHRAQVERGADVLRLEWCYDSAFRFFPVQPDDLFGYCLHPADLATNKVLALAGRAEVRDFLDILDLDSRYLSLGAIVWAACGKDEGYNPISLLDAAKRHVRYRQEDIDGEQLARPLDVQAAKVQWLEAVARAEELFARLPAEEVGCLYLDAAMRPVTPPADAVALVRHRGSIGGAWPTIRPSPSN